MSISDTIQNLNTIYNDIDELTQVPRDRRFIVSEKLEEIMDEMDSWLNEYDDEPDETQDEDDEEEEED